MQADNIGLFFFAMIATLYFTGVRAHCGSYHENYMSAKSLKKLTIPRDSILRKILIFECKDPFKGAYTYPRVIPFLICLIVYAVDLCLLIVNLFIQSSTLEFWIMAIASVSLLIFTLVYDVVWCTISRHI